MERYSLPTQNPLSPLASLKPYRTSCACDLLIYVIHTIQYVSTGDYIMSNITFKAVASTATKPTIKFTKVTEGMKWTDKPNMEFKEVVKKNINFNNIR